MLTDCYPPRLGGIESQVRDLSRELVRAGHEVEVFTATVGPHGERGGETTVGDDGKFTVEDPHSHIAIIGRHIDMGPSAVVRSQGVTILLTSIATAPVPWSVPPVPLAATVRPNSVATSTTVCSHTAPSPS